MKYILLLAISALVLTGCSHAIYNVPPGYIGKILTPTGWQSGTLEAGQVDIGDTDGAGRGNQLVLCEATAGTMKEFFSKADGPQGEDHRVITASKVPLAVDIYVQVAVPDDKRLRDSIFAQITSTARQNDARVSDISLAHIYIQFAQPTIRGKVRAIFSHYKDYNDVMANYDRVNTEISQMIARTFEDSKVPLRLIAGQLSNVKADETLWAAENRKAAADAEVSAIDKIGDAMRRNPAYLQKYKWDVLKEATGKGTTIIVSDGAGAPIPTIPVSNRP